MFFSKKNAPCILMGEKERIQTQARNMNLQKGEKSTVLFRLKGPPQVREEVKAKLYKGEIFRRNLREGNRRWKLIRVRSEKKRAVESPWEAGKEIPEAVHPGEKIVLKRNFCNLEFAQRNEGGEYE